MPFLLTCTDVDPGLDLAGLCRDLGLRLRHIGEKEKSVEALQTFL